MTEMIRKSPLRMERIVRPSGDGHGKSRGFSQGWSNVKRRSSRRGSSASRRSACSRKRQEEAEKGQKNQQGKLTASSCQCPLSPSAIKLGHAATMMWT